MTLTVAVLLLSAFGAKPKRCISKWVHRIAFCVFGLLSLGTIVLTFAYVLIDGSVYLKTSLLASFSTYFVVGILHGEIHHVGLTLLFYLFALPSFINIFQIHSMCNLHDVSWGTRPDAARGADIRVGAAAEDVTPNYGSIHNTNHGSTAQSSLIHMSPEDMHTRLFLGDTDDLDGGNGEKSPCCCGGRDSCCEQEKISTADKQHDFMLKTVFLWLSSNLFLVLCTRYELFDPVLFMEASMTLLFSIMVLRLIGSTMYALGRYCCCKSPWFRCCVA